LANKDNEKTLGEKIKCCLASNRINEWR